MSPILSQLYADGLMEAVSVPQTRVFEAAEFFARTEGTLPAPESSHAIRAAIDEALRCKREGMEENIFFGLTGTGYFDLVAYQKYNDRTTSSPSPARSCRRGGSVPHAGAGSRDSRGPASPYSGGGVSCGETQTEKLVGPGPFSRRTRTGLAPFLRWMRRNPSSIVHTLRLLPLAHTFMPFTHTSDRSSEPAASHTSHSRSTRRMV